MATGKLQPAPRGYRQAPAGSTGLQASSTLLELANVKLNFKYLISSICPKPMQELVEKYIKLGPVLFYIL
jgi:hypothetical protein